MIYDTSTRSQGSVSGVEDIHLHEIHPGGRVETVDAPPMGPRDTMFLVCTYTDNEILAHIPKGEPGEGIYAWHCCGETGKLTGPLHINAVAPNPAFITKHPSSDTLYVSTECIHHEGCGEVISMSVDEQGKLTELARESAGGRSTCYLTVVGELLAAVNYWDAIVTLLPIDAGKKFAAGAVVDQHMQPGASYVFENNPDRVEHWTYRQRWPHTHCFVTEPYTRKYHFVPDLGLDKIWCYCVNQADAKLELRGGVQLKKAQGPRHIVFHPRVPVVYVINELKSTISTLKFNAQALEASAGDMDMDANSPDSALVHMQTLRTLPDDFESHDHHKSHASEIRLHPNGTHVFVANRGHDSIAIYRVDEAKGGSLELMTISPSGGAFPRNFNFDTTGRFVLVGNQNSNDLCVFAFDGSVGTLTPVDKAHQPSPNYVFPVPRSSKSKQPPSHSGNVACSSASSPSVSPSTSPASPSSVVRRRARGSSSGGSSTMEFHHWAMVALLLAFFFCIGLDLPTSL